MRSEMEEINEFQGFSTPPMNAHVSPRASSSSCSRNTMAKIESIEDSKVHWSELSEVDSSMSGARRPNSVKGKILSKVKKVIGSALPAVGKYNADHLIVAENRKVFKTLQMHPQWGKFFMSYDTRLDSLLAVGEKFAEGAQAQIFNATYKQQDGPHINCVLKVFKKESLLECLQLQWPHGFLQWMGKIFGGREFFNRPKVVDMWFGTLMPNGEFAFIMGKEDKDLRKLIISKRGECSHGSGPFKEKTMERFLYTIALGMDWLHKHNIVHRDLKSSNVLVTDGWCYVADYECSIGVIGTGFWRDPQILQACKEGNASQRPELFSRAADVYSYGMTCYEILTGKLPFEKEVEVEGQYVIRDLIIEGKRPKVPGYVDEWICKLLRLCWQSNREKRPTFDRILNVINVHSIDPYIKASHVFNMKMNNEELNPRLGCNDSSHGFELLDHAPYESGVYTCKLCYKQGNGATYHCSSCSTFDLHPECATIPQRMTTFMHPHKLSLYPKRIKAAGVKVICNACGLEVLEGIYYNCYSCPKKECKFNVHIHCAKYARVISHTLHEEHELLLTYTFTIIREGKPPLVCEHCIKQLDSSEIIYCCRECGFNIHPYCITRKLECKSW